MMYRRYVLVEDTDGWRIWDDREGVWLNKFREPDPSYRAETREVAAMRVRDWAHGPVKTQCSTPGCTFVGTPTQVANHAARP